MWAVITGDVVQSRLESSPIWQNRLKDILSQYGQETKDWEIYRGDSFQLCLTADRAVLAALHLKAGFKRFEQLDLRMGIGLGSLDYPTEKVTHSTGTAFTHSGICFDQLKNQNVAIRSNNQNLDLILNVMFSLALLTMNSWTQTVAGVVQASLEHPDWNQNELAQLLNKSQSGISEALKRAAFDEIMQMEQVYKKLIAEYEPTLT